MDANGLVWVRCCAGSMGGHKNNTYRDQNGRASSDLALWPGKFPQTSCFANKKANGVWTVPDWCTWVYMGTAGCVHTGGQENKGKRDKNR